MSRPNFDKLADVQEAVIGCNAEIHRVKPLANGTLSVTVYVRPDDDGKPARQVAPRRNNDLYEDPSLI